MLQLFSFCQICQDALEAQFNLPLAADENTVPYVATDKRPGEPFPKKSVDYCR